MSLSVKAVDRLFERLLSTYGRDFQSYYAAVDPGAVKALWAHELSQFENNLCALAWALENLPEKCPNAIVFKNLCRQAPADVVPMLPSPKVDPVIAAMVIGEVRKTIATTGRRIDYKAWADSILAQHETGRKYSPTVVQMARNARPERASSLAHQ